MKQIRILLMSLPPLNPTIKLDCCSYAARRVGSGVLGFLDASSTLRTAFGNWKEAAKAIKAGSAMVDNYTENKVQLSATSKFIVQSRMSV